MDIDHADLMEAMLQAACDWLDNTEVDDADAEVFGAVREELEDREIDSPKLQQARDAMQKAAELIGEVLAARL